MRSFRRTPAAELPKEQYYRHILIVVVIGIVLVIAASMVSMFVHFTSGMRDAQQDGVRVHMAINRAAEEWTGLNRSYMSTDEGADAGVVDGQFAWEVCELAHATGDIRLYAFDEEAVNATRFTFDDGVYFVSYDADASPSWTITYDQFPVFSSTL